MKIKRDYVVSVKLPEGVGVYDMRQYIEEAVGIWCKSMDPDSPIFNLKADEVKVRTVKPEKVK